MDILNDIYKYADVIYTRIQQANALQHLKHLSVDNVVAVRQNKPIYSNTLYIGYGDNTFFNVYAKRYINLQAEEYEEIMLIYYLTQYVVKNFAVFMCTDKKFFSYAKNVINFFNKSDVNINYDFLHYRANKQMLTEYKQMLLNYAKLMHKTYVYSKRVSKEMLIKLRIDSGLLIKNKNFTQNVLIDYYLLYFLKHKQNLKLLSFLSKRKQKALKTKLKRRLQKIKNVNIDKKDLAKAVDIDEDYELLKYFFGEKTNEEERLKIVAAYVVLNSKTDSRAEA